MSALVMAAAASLALVVQDPAVLRAGPSDSSAVQSPLTRGDALEVRGAKLDYLQVWDHRRERGGYVLASQVRATSLEARDAPELFAVTRFLRSTPGMESLGIAYAAAYLKAVPAQALSAEPFDAIGEMADRLADRASTRGPTTSASATTALAAQVEAVAAYGVRMTTLERDDTARLCYDGDAWRQVLAMTSSTPEQRARAALGLTRPDCLDPEQLPAQLQASNEWRAAVLDRLDANQFAQLAALSKNRLHMRRAGVWATLAFERQRTGDDAASLSAGQRALDELAAVDKRELADDDQSDYNDAAMRVGASRWAAEMRPVADAKPARLSIRTRAGQPGETCVLLVDAAHDADHALAQRCSWGLVWAASASPRADQNALALAVQPLEGWRELWMFRKVAGNWRVDVVPPADADPSLGYLEFAGWVPGSDRMLVAREARFDNRYRHRFEVMKLDSFDTERWAAQADSLGPFLRWPDPAWKRTTVSLR